MDKYMLLEAESLTPADINRAVKRAHQLRSEATWNVFIKLGQKISKLFHSNVSGGSGLAHSS